MTQALLGPSATQRRIGLGPLALLALASVASWLVAEAWSSRRPDPNEAIMLRAARAVQAAASALRAEKEARGLMQPADLDPNRTGMIGQEFTAITTTVGDIQSKRTATNPDLAAVLVRRLAALKLPAGTPVVMVTSGSFVGGNVAAIAAVEALGLQPVVLASLSASMYGANDPDFTWADMAGLLRRRGIIATPITVAVMGGENGSGKGIDAEGTTALRAAVAREGIPLIEADALAGVVDKLLEAARRAMPPGREPGLVVNVGGALVALGNCRESFAVQPGLGHVAATCTQGVPGVVLRLSDQRMPVLHLLNFKRLAAEFGLPVDPVPLPAPGETRTIYRRQ